LRLFPPALANLGPEKNGDFFLLFFSFPVSQHASGTTAFSGPRALLTRGFRPSHSIVSIFVALLLFPNNLLLVRCSQIGFSYPARAHQLYSYSPFKLIFFFTFSLHCEVRRALSPTEGQVGPLFRRESFRLQPWPLLASFSFLPLVAHFQLLLDAHFFFFAISVRMLAILADHDLIFYRLSCLGDPPS